MPRKAPYAPINCLIIHETPDSNKRWNARWRRRLEDGWVLEFFCVVLGTLLMITLYAVLASYDGRPPPRFGSSLGGGLTLNTVVAIIATFGKAALLLPVAECISQHKWFWYQQPRSLDDISVFDSASRGLWGALELVRTTRLKSFAVVGTFLIVIGFAIDPLSQQLVLSTNIRQVDHNSKATASVVSNWNEASGIEASVMGTIGADYNPEVYNAMSTGMRSAILTGLYSGTTNIKDVEPSCPSGNCTFNGYNSLAICASVVKTSSGLDLTFVDNSTYPPIVRYYASTHQFIDGNAAYEFNLSSATPDYRLSNTSLTSQPVPLNFTDSVAFENVSLPIADGFAMWLSGYTDSQGNTAHSAVEYVLGWCVKNYSTTVLNGRSTTQSHGSISNPDPGQRPVLYPFSDPNTKYAVNEATHYTLQRYLRSTLKGTVQIALSGTQWYATSDAAQALYEPFDIYSGDHTGQPWPIGIRGTNETGLEHIFDNIATSMTNFIRTSGGGDSPSTIDGTVWLETTHITVRWKWITIHAIFNVVCVLFLLVTVFWQRRSSLVEAGAWKSSSLAVMKALDPGLHGQLRGISRPLEMALQSQRQQVKLTQTSSDGWRLVPRQGNAEELDQLRPR